MAPALLTLGDNIFHQLWFGARSHAGDRIGGAGMAETSPHVDMLFMAIFWISVVSFVFLMALTAIFTVKYRRQPGVPVQRSAAHNTPLELAWTALPLIVLVWIFFEGFWGYIDGQVGGALPEEISLQAQKWRWTMTYSNGAASAETTLIGTEKQPVFVAPADTPVLLKMHSIDVIHSFWVPDFRWKQDVFPNRYTAFTFKTPPLDHLDPSVLTTAKHKDGTSYQCIEHYIFCAEFCGDMHSEMAAVLRIVPPKDYVKIVTDWATPTGTPAERGEKWAIIKGCVSCHSADGSRKTGPSWKDMYNHEAELEGGGKVLVDESYIRESIYVPSAKIVLGYPNSMVSFQGQVNEAQLSDLIAYMKSISKYTPPSMLDEANKAPADGAEKK